MTKQRRRNWKRISVPKELWRVGKITIRYPGIGIILFFENSLNLLLYEFHLSVLTLVICSKATRPWTLTLKLVSMEFVLYNACGFMMHASQIRFRKFQWR